METYKNNLRDAVEKLATANLELKTLDRNQRRLAQKSEPTEEEQNEMKSIQEPRLGGTTRYRKAIEVKDTLMS